MIEQTYQNQFDNKFLIENGIKEIIKHPSNYSKSDIIVRLRYIEDLIEDKNII